TLDLTGQKVKSATIQLAVDDRFTLNINGGEVGSHHGWKPPQQYSIGHLLKPGINVIAVEAENVKANVPANPAGLICSLSILLADGRMIEIASDSSWRCSKQPSERWLTPGFVDSSWQAAKVIAEYGAGPWGKIDPIDDKFEVPYCAGIPHEVRVVYVP